MSFKQKTKSCLN